MQLMKTINPPTTPPQPVGRVDRVIQKLMKAQAENRRLKAKLSRQNRYSSIVLRAVADAHVIMMSAFSGDPVSRRSMADQGMSQRQWEWGIAFLRYAGIIAMQNADWREGLTWSVDRLDEATELLKKAAHELDNERGYQRLRAIVKRKRRSW